MTVLRQAAMVRITASAREALISPMISISPPSFSCHRVPSALSTISIVRGSLSAARKVGPKSRRSFSKRLPRAASFPLLSPFSVTTLFTIGRQNFVSRHRFYRDSKQAARKNRDFLCYSFTSSHIFSRPSSRHSLTENSAKINFTVHDAMLRKLDREEKLTFQMVAHRPLRPA